MIKTNKYCKFDKEWNALEEYTDYQVNVIFGSNNQEYYENDECYAVRLHLQEISDLQDFNSETMEVSSGHPYYDSENNIAVKPLVISAKD